MSASTPLKRLFPLVALLAVFPIGAFAGEGGLDLTGHWVGYASVGIFVLAYLLVMLEEVTGLRKSKPVMLGAGLIWALIAWVNNNHGLGPQTDHAIRETIEEYAELLLFLIAAMSYVNAMTERGVFDALQSWLVRKGFGYRALFLITGTISFLLSPVLDNLTTALVLCAVVLAVGKENPKFVGLSCISIVVGANAGGAFSPFGDITTLMVWQSGQVEFWQFFDLFIPACVNYAVPAALMYFAVPDEHPPMHDSAVEMKRGGKRVIVLFMMTIATAVLFHNFLDLPPVLGMMTGLGYLSVFGYYLQKTHVPVPGIQEEEEYGSAGDITPFDVFRYIARAEWDTLMFFYGVILCVGGLAFIGYMAMASNLLYVQWSATWANITVGVLSAIVDNIPIMAAVLKMAPNMPHAQWLLVTMTAGVGGSLLSIGSAAGVALMGQARGRYTFFSHLKWSWAVAAGYVASIAVHIWINGNLL